MKYQSQVLAMIGIVLGSTSLGIGFSAQETTDKQVRVPDVRNLTPEIARQKIHLSQLKNVQGKFYLTRANWRPELIEGKVYLQTPQPGTRSKTQATVATWIFLLASSKQKIVSTPDLKQTTLTAAKSTLSKVGLDIMIVDVPTLPSGIALQPEQIIDQYPRPNQKVLTETTVLVHVFRPQKDESGNGK